MELCSGRYGRSLSEEDVELEKQLKSLNMPYVRTFKDEYGITYDCVDMYKQPALDHPLCKNHILQMGDQRGVGHVRMAWSIQGNGTGLFPNPLGLEHRACVGKEGAHTSGIVEPMTLMEIVQMETGCINLRCCGFVQQMALSP